MVAGDGAHPTPQHGVLFVGRSSISDSTFYADRIIVPCHPKVIVMYAGDNDIAEGDTPRQVLEEFKAFVARVRHDLPEVAIAYISIKPSIARFAMWPRMREANRLISEWSRTQSRIAFVDVAPKMLDAHGKPRAALLREDGLHMTSAGYAAWIEALEPVLAGYA